MDASKQESASTVPEVRKNRAPGMTQMWLERRGKVIWRWEARMIKMSGPFVLQQACPCHWGTKAGKQSCWRVLVNRWDMAKRVLFNFDC